MKSLGRLARVCVLGNRPSVRSSSWVPTRPLVAALQQRSHPPAASVSTRSLAEDAVCSSLSAAQAEPPSHIRAIRAAKETVPPPDQVRLQGPPDPVHLPQSRSCLTSRLLIKVRQILRVAALAIHPRRWSVLPCGAKRAWRR